MLVYFFVTAGGHALEFAGPGDLFEEANRRAGRRVYDVHFVSLRPGLVTCLSGAQLMLEGTMRDRDEPLDTLTVTGAREPLSRLSPEIANWLRRQTPRTRRYGAIGTGAFLLGAAGLLDNKHVTTDWEFISVFAETFPMAIINPERTLVRDGAVFTSAAGTAALDLTLSLIEEDLGASTALALARCLGIFLSRPGPKSQFGTKDPSHRVILDVQQWIRDNLQTGFSLSDRPGRAGMSPRSFTRVFHEATGVTPAEFVEVARIDAASRLLSETNQSMQRIALAVGFAGTQALRRAFLRRVGIRPADYRARRGSLS